MSLCVSRAESGFFYDASAVLYLFCLVVLSVWSLTRGAVVNMNELEREQLFYYLLAAASVSTILEYGRHGVARELFTKKVHYHFFDDSINYLWNATLHNVYNVRKLSSRYPLTIIFIPLTTNACTGYITSQAIWSSRLPRLITVRLYGSSSNRFSWTVASVSTAIGVLSSFNIASEAEVGYSSFGLFLDVFNNC